MKIRTAYRFSLLATVLGAIAGAIALSMFRVGDPDWLYLIIPLLLGIAMPSAFLRGLMRPATSRQGIKVSTAAAIVFISSMLLMIAVLIVQGADLSQSLTFLAIIVIFGSPGVWMVFQISKGSTSSPGRSSLDG